jgi:hypothetical protein
MRVFISWSGASVSKRVALELGSWLPTVLESVIPFVSHDIGVSERWQDVIGAELEKSDFGIVCLTPENLTKPWLMFEAGALSKKLSAAKVVAFLLGVEPSDLSNGPLAQFQATPFDKEQVWNLILTLEESPNPDFIEQDLHPNFDTLWPRLEEALRPLEEEARSTRPEALSPHEPRMQAADRAVLEEVLSVVRSLRLAAPAARVPFSEEQRRNAIISGAARDFITRTIEGPESNVVDIDFGNDTLQIEIAGQNPVGDALHQIERFAASLGMTSVIFRHTY